jgi:hypothetical protein
MRRACCRLALLAPVLFGSASCSATPKTDDAGNAPTAKAIAAGESCAAKLPPDASSIYRVSAPDMRRDTDLRSLLRKQVMFMVIKDEIQRSAARPAAEKAAACLQLLRQ